LGGNHVTRSVGLPTGAKNVESLELIVVLLRGHYCVIYAFIHSRRASKILFFYWVALSNKELLIKICLLRMHGSGFRIYATCIKGEIIARR